MPKQRYKYCITGDADSFLYRYTKLSDIGEYFGTFGWKSSVDSATIKQCLRAGWLPLTYAQAKKHAPRAFLSKPKRDAALLDRALRKELDEE